ncbi:MAG: glycosyltransferase [Mobilicoccus sp.]|nr:glycosyltransferase [Mobilicoccus sp.]
MSRAFDVSIVTSGHDVADARLHREAAALVAAGLRVEVLGLGRVEDGPPDTSVRTWSRAGGVRRAALAARMASRAGGRVLMTLDPDSALAAHTAVLVSGRELVVDVHEDYAALLSDRAWTARFGGGAGRAARSLVRSFQRIAGRAALTVVADDHVPPQRARRRLVLPNEPDLSMLPEPTDPGPTPRALYVGDVRTSRGLFAMLAALRAAPAWHLDVVGPVAPADADALSRVLSEDADLAGRVTFYGRRPPREAWALAQGAWVGMLLLHDTPAFRDALPSKVGEYLACGLPVVTTDLPRQAALVRGEADEADEATLGAVVPTGTDEAIGDAVAAHLNTWAQSPGALHGKRQAVLAASVRGRDTDPYAEFAQAVTDLLHPHPDP